MPAPKPAEDRHARRRAIREAAAVEPRYPAELPVAAHREAILQAIRNSQVVVVQADTGSGKTTQLPKMLLELGYGVAGEIAHTQPRRLAARATALRPQRRDHASARDDRWRAAGAACRGLHAYIDELQVQLNAAGQAVFESYVLLPGEVGRHFPRGTRPESLSDWQREQQQQQQQ